VRERYDDLERVSPTDSHKLKVRVASTGAWHQLDIVISRMEAKISKVLAKGDEYHTKAQWMDRMSCRNANADQALDCWNQCKDMVGNEYSKITWKDVEYMKIDQVLTLTAEKRVDKVLHGGATKMRMGARALEDAFAPSSLGFASDGDGRRTLRRSGAKDL